jgi:hypothetical protein
MLRGISFDPEAPLLKLWCGAGSVV